jgi:N-acetylneuraminate synthase
MRLGKREIRNFGDPYIIAELGANHNGDMNIARRLIDAAKKAGCDCVKFQSWTKTSLFSKKIYSSDTSNLKTKKNGAKEPSLEELLEKYSISESELREMADYCRASGIGFASSPFSEREADFLADELDAPFLKVASMDLNNLRFLDYVARKKKPVFLSTGLGTLSEIERAVRTLEKAGNKQIIILHCVSIYPLPDEHVNLNNIDMLRKRFPNYPIGFSDHTLGVEAPLAAFAKGAAVLEKHFTLDRAMEGWDHSVSATPEEMKAIVHGARRIWKCLGSFERTLSETEKKNIPNYRRSVVAARRIEKGRVIGAKDLTAKRPGSGIPAEQMTSIVGRKAKRTIEADELLMKGDF